MLSQHNAIFEKGEDELGRFLSLLIDAKENVCIMFRRVEPGFSRIGSDKSIPLRVAAPVRIVEIPYGFWMAETPITRGQYDAVMPHRAGFGENKEHLPSNTDFFQAQHFCIELSRLTERLVRLPYEHEWEHACRAGSMSDYWYGETFDPDLSLSATTVGTFDDDAAWLDAVVIPPKTNRAEK